MSGIIVAICIGLAGHLVVFLARYFNFDNGTLISVGLIIGFVGTIAITFAWANALFYIKLQKMLYYLFISFALGFVVTIPTALLPVLSLLSPCLCMAITALFWIIYTRIQSGSSSTIRQSTPEERRSYWHFPRGMLIILIVALLLSGFIREIIGVDSEESFDPINVSSLARSAFSFVIAIIVVAACRLSHYSRRALLMSWAVLMAILFAGLLIVASLSQLEFAVQVATVLVASSKTFLSFFLWIMLICVPPHKLGGSVITSSAVYFLIDTVYSFLLGGVLIILKSLGFHFLNFVGPLSLLAALIFIVVGLIFFNTFGISHMGSDGDHSDTKIDAIPNFASSLEKLKRTYQLSDREAEVLELIAQGRSYQKVAETLYVTKSTVQTHVENLYRKLGVHSKQAAIDMLLNPTDDDL